MMTQFVTHGGFDQMFQVWNFVAMFFSDSDARYIFSVIFALSAGLGTWFAVMEGLKYNKIDFLRFAKVFIFGILFYGMFLTNTDDYDLTLFDDVTFQNANIEGIPDGIIFLACAANNLTINLEAKVWALASSPVGTWTYGAASEGAGMRLLRESYEGKMAGIFNQVLSATVFNTVNEYMQDCFSVEAAANATVLSTVNSTNIVAALGNGANPALTTTSYIDNAGALLASPTSLNCEDAYDNLVTYLTSARAAGGDFDQVVDTFCTLMAADQAGLRSASGTGNSCREVLAQSLNSWVDNGGGANANVFAEQIFIAREWQKYLQGLDSAEAIARSADMNRVSAELGNRVLAAAEWLPVLKNTLLMVIVGLLPFLAMFAVTASAVDAVKFAIGMFIWWGLWCILDVMFLAFWLGHAERVFDIIHSAPAYTVQAMTDLWPLASRSLDLLGELRFFGLTLSAAVTAGILKVGGYALASMGQNMTRSIYSTAGVEYMPGNAQGAQTSVNSSITLGRDQVLNAGGSGVLDHSGVASGFAQTFNLSQHRGAMEETSMRTGDASMGSMSRANQSLGFQSGANMRAGVFGEHTNSSSDSHYNAGKVRAGNANAVKGVSAATGMTPEQLGRAGTSTGLGGSAERITQLRNLMKSPTQLGEGANLLTEEQLGSIAGKLGGMNEAVRNLGMANATGFKLVGSDDGSWTLHNPDSPVLDGNVSGIHFSEIGIRTMPLINKFASQVLSGDTEGARKTGAQIYQLANTAGEEGQKFLSNTKWQGMHHTIQDSVQASRINNATGGNFRIGDQVSFGMSPNLAAGTGSLHNVVGGDRTMTDHTDRQMSGSTSESLSSVKAEGMNNYAYFVGNIGGEYGYYRLRGEMGSSGAVIKGDGYLAKLNAETGRFEENSLPVHIEAKTVGGAGLDAQNMKRNDYHPDYIPVQSADTKYSYGSQVLSAGDGVVGKNAAIETLGGIVQGLGRSGNVKNQAESAAFLFFGTPDQAERNLYQAVDEQNAGYRNTFTQQVNAASNLGNQSNISFGLKTNGTVLGKIAELGGGASASVGNATTFSESMSKHANQLNQGDIFKAAMHAIAHSDDDIATKAMKAQQVLDLRHEFMENLAGKTDSTGDISAGHLFHDAQAKVFQDSADNIAAGVNDVRSAELNPQDHTVKNDSTVFDFGGKKWP